MPLPCGLSGRQTLLRASAPQVESGTLGVKSGVAQAAHPVLTPTPPTDVPPHIPPVLKNILRNDLKRTDTFQAQDKTALAEPPEGRHPGPWGGHLAGPALGSGPHGTLVPPPWSRQS